MQRQITLTVLLVLLATLAYADNNDLNLVSTMVRGKVFQKIDSAQLFQLQTGKYALPTGTVVLTYFDGQCFLEKAKNFELRLKEDSSMCFISSSSFELRKGTMGIKNASYPIAINTPHLNIEFDDAMVVIKVNPVLTRVCVIRGKAEVWQGKSRDKISVSVNQEIAAAPGRVSKPYPRSDELRFTWYWVEPAKEPGLQ